MTKFINGSIYQHINATTLDMKVVKIQYACERRIKLKVEFIYRLTGKVAYIGGFDSKCNVEVQRKDLANWSRL